MNPNTLYLSGKDYDNEYLDYTRDIEFILELARRYGGSSPIVEFACGTGRVTIPLARNGFSVMGVDIAPTMLSEARIKLSREEELIRNRVTLYEGDMCTFRTPISGKQAGGHNLALVPFTAFLHLTTVQAQIDALKNCSHHLRSQGGYLLVDIFNPDPTFLARGLTAHAPVLEKEVQIEDGTQTLVRYMKSTYWSDKQLYRWEFFVEIYDNGSGQMVRKYKREATVGVIFPNEWRERLRIAGFSICEEWGDFDMSPFTSTPRRMLFLAKRTHNPLV